MKQTVLLAALLGGALLSCKKEVEVIKIQEVEKQYSWREVRDPNLFGYNSIMLGIAPGRNGLFVQQPRGFGAFREQPGGRLKLTQYGYVFPTDISFRVPIAPDFFASRGYVDSLVAIVPTADPVFYAGQRMISLKRLDPLALRLRPNYYASAKFGAINRNDYLLFSYESTLGTGENKIRLVLSRITPPASAVEQPTADSRVIHIPYAGIGVHPSFPVLIQAIDDFFLVDCGQEGVYKITQNGNYRRVVSSPVFALDFHRRQNRLYLVGSQLGYSDDNGDTWQLIGATPSALASSYYTVGDSAVGVLGNSNTLFTSRISTTGYRLRLLKSDGLPKGDITGLATWRDTVYVATTAGLYKRPLSTFFEGGPTP